MRMKYIKVNLIYTFSIYIFLLCSTAAALPRFNVNEIPTQTVWHDVLCEFLVHWEDNAGASFDVVADPEPVGHYELVYDSATDVRFKYTPDEDDKHPFTVSISADSGDDWLSHSFEIIPMANLIPEQDVFSTESHTQPGTGDSSDIDIFDNPSLLLENFNYNTTTTHSLRIIGEEIIFEEGHENGLYESYNDRRDIKEMEIIAERLIIRSPLRLKQTNVIISARELRFEGADAKIITTPEEKTTKPPFNSDATPGAHGMKAGNIELNIGSFYSDSPTTKFDLTGGKGQPGEDGKDGVEGVSVDVYWTGFKWSDWPFSFSYNAPEGVMIIYYIGYNQCAVGIPIKAFEHGTASGKPTSGGDATSPGQPGDGGDGGVLSSNYDVAPFASYNGGLAGTPAKPPYGRSYYRGGYRGYPYKWEKKRAYYCVTARFQTLSSGETENGDPADLKTGTSGGYAYPAIEEKPYAWLNPLLVGRIFNDAKNAYISNWIQDAEERLEEYVSLIDAYKNDSSWDDLSEGEQYELLQMSDEMKIFLHRIENGLDYFGNPAGWVPMLSFEVNTTVFDQEIDRAINMLYLAYWVKNKAATEQQRVDALKASRDQLRLEIEQAKLDYDAAASKVPIMKNKAQSLQTRTQELIWELEAKETELVMQATNNLRPPWWEVSIRMGLKTAGTICTMIPVYQPVLGAVGGGMTLASNFDPDKPWDTIIGGADLTTNCFSEQFNKASDDQKNALKGIDPDSVESKKIEYLGDMRDASKGLSAGLTDMKTYLGSLEASESEINAELEKLKEESDEYKELVQKIEDLLIAKKKFIQELASVMQSVSALSNTIVQNILAIDAMNRQISAGIAVLDPKATMYLDNMERRAYDRLLKYHYYMAKAYEYRLLQPYTATLDFEALINKFVEIADLNTDHTITPAQFNTLKSLYKDQLAEVAETILADYNANRPELSVPVRFNLTSDELTKINNGESVMLNLINLGIFPLSEENIRIVEFKVYSMSTVPGDGNYGSIAFVDFDIEHSGISNIKSDGEVLQFKHYNQNTTNPIVWGARYDPIDDLIDPKEPSEASDSLLRSLLGGSAPQDIMLYSRPSAWANLEISKTATNSSGADIDIISLRLELKYDFTPKNELLGLMDLEVLVAAEQLDQQNNVILSDADFTPYFMVDMPDVNYRQDARGRFIRIFNIDSLMGVDIKAQHKYGNWVFSKWTDRYGIDLPGGPLMDKTISISLGVDQAVRAQYISYTLLFDDDKDGDIDGTDLVEFAGVQENGISLSDFAANFGYMNENNAVLKNIATPVFRSKDARNIEWGVK